MWSKKRHSDTPPSTSSPARINDIAVFLMVDQFQYGCDVQTRGSGHLALAPAENVPETFQGLVLGFEVRFGIETHHLTDDVGREHL